MQRIVPIILIFLISCSNLEKVTLYDAEIKSTEGINGFTSINIFSSGGTDEVWGNSNKLCNPMSFSSMDASIDYSLNNMGSSNIESTKADFKVDLPTVKVKDKKGIEKNSLHIKTDYPATCDWIGMGIGWDGWQGKDLTNIIEGAAIQFMARVDEGPIYNIPIVFILEDYSANQCYATASYLGIDGGMVTNKWTKVQIPLPTFSYNQHNIDLSNIKQLLLQCYDKIDIYIDDIKIVSHKHKYKKVDSSLTVVDTIFPIDIFSNKLKSSLAIDNKYCNNFKLKTSPNYNDGNFINVHILNDCNWKDFIISWNNWLYTDLSSSIYSVDLKFDLKISNLTSANITFDDYSGKKMSVNLLDYVKHDNKDWQQVCIPMKKFPIRNSEINLKEIKSIIFSFTEKTNLKIDNIKLTKKI